jgi:hypothetical protein
LVKHFRSDWSEMTLCHECATVNGGKISDDERYKLGV